MARDANATGPGTSASAPPPAGAARRRARTHPLRLTGLLDVALALLLILLVERDEHGRRLLEDRIENVVVVISFTITLALALGLGLAGLVVGAGVLGSAARHDSVGDAHDGGEPDQREGLQRHQQREEAELDAAVEAHDAIGVRERLHDVRPYRAAAVAGDPCADARRRVVASVRHHPVLRYLRPDRPAHQRERDVPRQQPRDQEQAECDVACCLEAEIVEHLGELVWLSVSLDEESRS